jgi:hypothetical protein
VIYFVLLDSVMKFQPGLNFHERRELALISKRKISAGIVYRDMMIWKMNTSHCVMFLSEFVLIEHGHGD